MGSGSEASRVIDAGFPRSVLDLTSRLLEQQQSIYGQDAVKAAVEPMLWDGEGVKPAEMLAAVPANLRVPVENVMRALTSVTFAPYLGRGKMGEAAHTRVAAVNAGARKLLRQYLRQATRNEREATSDTALSALGLPSLDAVEEFLAKSTTIVGPGETALPFPGQIVVERVQSRSVLVSWAVRVPTKSRALGEWQQQVEVRKLHSKEEKEASIGVVVVESGSGRRIAGGEYVRCLQLAVGFMFCGIFRTEVGHPACVSLHFVGSDVGHTTDSSAGLPKSCSLHIPICFKSGPVEVTP
eukprot:2807960-Rhodomonas_salina.4